MWESDDEIEYIYNNLTVYPDPMEGVNV